MAATKIQSLVRMFIQRKRFKKENKRKNIVLELYQTEVSYVKNLSVIIEVFLKPLQELEKKGKEMIPVETRKLIFGNVDETLYISHNNLSEKIEERTKKWTIDSMIGDICDNFFKRKKIVKYFFFFFLIFFYFLFIVVGDLYKLHQQL